MSRVSIVTLGCPKNAIDSEGLGGLLAAGGHDVTDVVEGSDVVLINTCGFIDPARRETVQEVLDAAEMKAAGDVGAIVMAGCLVARSSDELAGELPEVDALIDFEAYGRISEIIDSVVRGDLAERVQGNPGTRFDPAYWDATIAASPRLRFGRAPWSYLKIAEGCDRGCTFCAIPLMRGKLRSRSIDTVVTEARHLAAGGVSELSLVSQDSVMWGRDTGEGTLGDLLRALETVDGIERLRLMYLHPQGLTDDVIETMLSSEVIVPYFDLSLQHISAPILKAMGRWGDRDRFDSLISRVRETQPLAGVRVTFIAGFPGESDSDAAEVESFIDDHDLDWIGVFTYSQEPGTRSHDLPDQVAPAVARERTERISAAADRAMSDRAVSLHGKQLRVLVERLDLATGTWSGRSHREAPEVDGEISFSADGVRVGDYVEMIVTGNDGLDLLAAPV